MFIQYTSILRLGPLDNAACARLCDKGLYALAIILA
jgi:hypothetical protein